MSNPQKTEFRLMGRELDGAQAVLAESFPTRMVNIVIQEAIKEHGEESTLIPTDVNFMPVHSQDENYFAVQAWHETEAPQGKVGILQPFLGEFEIILGEEDGFLHCREATDMHRLTTREVVGLIALSNIAATYDAIASPVNQEAIED